MKNYARLAKSPASRFIVSWTFKWDDDTSDMLVLRHLNWGDPTEYKMPKENARLLWQTLIEDGYVVHDSHVQ